VNVAFPDLDPPIIWEIIAPEEVSAVMRAPVASWLAPEEGDVFAALLVEGRRREWCAGRLAVKRAVRRWLKTEHGVAVSPSEVAVSPDARGAPHVTAPSLVEALSVSIAHADGYGFAAVCPAASDVRVGVDMERLRDVRPRLLARLLGPGETGSERVQPPDTAPLDAVTLWTLKEATVKALGVGLRLPMRCLTVSVTAPGRVTICRAPLPPAVDDYDARPWTAVGSHTRWSGFAFAIVTVMRKAASQKR
jgi:4'-phosphopantetheinyl transferase